MTPHCHVCGRLTTYQMIRERDPGAVPYEELDYWLCPDHAQDQETS